MTTYTRSSEHARIEIGALLLVLGVYTRYVALALVPILLGATWMHVGDGAYALQRSRRLGAVRAAAVVGA